MAPTATFSNTSPVNEGSTYGLSFANTTDLSLPDQSAGFEYAFDCGTGIFGGYSSTVSITCPTAVDNGNRSVRGRVRDKDGGVSTYGAQQRVLNVVPTVAVTATTSTTIPLGGTFGISVLFTDPGTQDNPWKGTISWGGGKQTTFTSTTQGVPVLRSQAYTRRGLFSVKVTVQDKNGGKGTSNVVTVRVT